MRSALAICVLAILSGISLDVASRDVLKVTGAYILEAPPTARSNVGYAVIANSSRRPVKLLAIDSERFSRMEMHSMRTENGVMQMRNERTLEVPAKGELQFAPGAFHLMLFGGNPPLRAGDEVELLFQSASGDETRVAFEVKAQPGMETDSMDPANPAALAPAVGANEAPADATSVVAPAPSAPLATPSVSADPAPSSTAMPVTAPAADVDSERALDADATTPADAPIESDAPAAPDPDGG